MLHELHKILTGWWIVDDEYYYDYDEFVAVFPNKS
jgi:hypothetical protein